MEYQALPELEHASTRILYRAKTIFPFDLFPDVIEVTDTEVKIIFGTGFFSNQIVHMPIRELMNVQLHTNLFFGALTFEIKGFENNPQTVKFLKRSEAVDADAIVSGLILCALNKVDTLQYEPGELVPYLISIGQPETVAA